MLVVRKAEEKDRQMIADSTLEGFKEDFAPFNIVFGKKVVEKFLYDALNLSTFFVAELDGKSVACLALSYLNDRALSGATEIGKQRFGWLKSKLVALGLQEFEETLPFDENTGFIELVSVVKEYRRKNIASNLIKACMEQTHYQTYVLDVKDINLSAIACYEKLGFVEFDRKPAGLNFEKGFKQKLLMKITKTSDTKIGNE